MNENDQSKENSPKNQPVVTVGASNSRRPGAQALLDSYKKNLQFIAEVSQARRDGFAAALKLRQEMIQEMLEQATATPGRPAAQQDALKQALERRLAAIRNFAEVTGASNQKFADAADRRMSDWCDEIGRSLPNDEGDAHG